VTFCLENLFLMMWFECVDRCAGEDVPAHDWQVLIRRTRDIARENGWTTEQTDEFLERLSGFMDSRATATPIIRELLRLESRPVTTTRF